MRIALLADLHSNLEALDACMLHARGQGADAFAFLGDLVGYGADPVAVVERVADASRRGALVLKGNHDEAVARVENTLNDEARRAIDWTRGQLDGAHAAFLEGLGLIVTRDRICYVHASANDPGRWNYIIDDLAARASIAAVDSAWTFCGHVHDQALYYQGAGRRMIAFRPVPGVWIPIGRHRRWLAIVGSCGQPRDGNSAAAYALFDVETCRLVFHRVPYDFARAAAKIRAAGLPEVFAQRLEGHV